MRKKLAALRKALSRTGGGREGPAGRESEEGLRKARGRRISGAGLPDIPYRDTDAEKGPVLYHARAVSGERDRTYVFFYQRKSRPHWSKLWKEWSWYACVLRTPDLGSRPWSTCVCHVDSDDGLFFVNWDQPVEDLRDMEQISRVWADCMQRYIHTGERFG